MAKITERETKQIDKANVSGRPPAVFIHGLWLLPSSWERWAIAFEEAGYAALTPSWPDDPETVDEARANPKVFAKKTVGQVADQRLARGRRQGACVRQAIRLGTPSRGTRGGRFRN